MKIHFHHFFFAGSVITCYYYMPWAEVVVELDPSQSAVKDAAVRVEGVRGPGGAWVARPGSLVELRSCW